VIIVLGTCIIIGREIVISALREWMASQGKRDDVAVSMLGKYKTFVQMFALGFLLYRDDWYGLPTHTIGLVLLVGAVILTIVSMMDYMKAGWKAMKAHLFKLLDINLQTGTKPRSGTKPQKESSFQHASSWNPVTLNP